jgi:NAD(P)-dependent dehydrogenase (short-subunit alcohol dehydrogenase family)
MSEVIIITGASSGIGAATARILAAQGANIVINYKSSKDLADGVVNEVKKLGGNAIAVQGDMGSEADIVRLYEETDRVFGAVTGVVNNAAINSPAHRKMIDYQFDEVMQILGVNAAGVLISCREAVKRMSTKSGGKGGSIVNVSSIGALTGSQGRFIHYAGSKGAVDVMTLGIAAEVVREGIRVNAIRPGMVDTPIHAKTGDANRVAEAAKLTPLGRAGRPEEVGESIVWLLSDKASLVTGAILNVMGAQR